MATGMSTTIMTVVRAGSCAQRIRARRASPLGLGSALLTALLLGPAGPRLAGAAGGSTEGLGARARLAAGPAIGRATNVRVLPTDSRAGSPVRARGDDAWFVARSAATLLPDVARLLDANYSLGRNTPRTRPPNEVETQTIRPVDVRGQPGPVNLHYAIGSVALPSSAGSQREWRPQLHDRWAAFDAKQLELDPEALRELAAAGMRPFEVRLRTPAGRALTGGEVNLADVVEPLSELQGALIAVTFHPTVAPWTPTELWWGCNLQPAAIRAMARHPGGADLPLRPSAVDDQAITLGGGAFHSRDNPQELQVVQFHP